MKETDKRLTKQLNDQSYWKAYKFQRNTRKCLLRTAESTGRIN